METNATLLECDPIGVGRIAEVYAWGDGQVLKLFRPEYPLRWAEHEAEMGRAVYAAGVRAPAVGKVIEVEGRGGIVYERVDGPTMLYAVGEKPLTMLRAARQLAELHAQMHDCTAPSLPAQRENMRGSIQNSPQLSDDLKARLLAHLDTLPDGDAVCHGDFHPDNVILTARGPVTIDWITASRGAPMADVARTKILFLSGGLPASAEGPQNLTARLLLRLRRVFYWIYIRHYCKLRSISRADIEPWLPIQAAIRLNEQVLGDEKARLLAWVDEGLSQVEVA